MMLQILGASAPIAIDTRLDHLGDSECGSNSKWYVVHIGPGYDALIMRWFQWLNLEYYQFTRLDRQPKKKPVRRSVFPGYLFVKFDADENQWKIIPQIPGVVRILSAGVTQLHPLPLPDGMMEAMIGQHCEIIEPEIIFKVRQIVSGDKIKIISGPFRQFEAECSSTDGEVIEAIINVLGRASKVKIPRSAVAQIKEKST